MLYKYPPTKINNTQKEKQFADGKNKKLTLFGLEADPFADGWRERATEREKSRPFC